MEDAQDEHGDSSGNSVDQMRDQKRKSKWWKAAILIAATIWIGWCAYLGLASSEDISDGRRRVNRVRSVSLAQIINGRHVADLRAAEAEMRTGYNRLSSPVLMPLRLVPVLGRQIRSARSLTITSADALDAGLDGLAVVRTTIDRQGVQPEQRPQMLITLADEADKAYRRLLALDLGPQKGLVGPLADARNEISERLVQTTRDLDRARSGLRQFAALLDGKSRYLLLAANNAEMRAGSGMFLSAGELMIDNGRLGITKIGSVTDIDLLDKGEVPVDPEVMSTWGWAQPGRDLRDVGVTPRFDVSADLAVRMWEKARGVTLDGAMAVDPIVLRELLQAVGPVKANGKMFNSNNVVDQLLHQQYLDFEADADRDRAGRQATLGAVAQAAFISFDSFKWDATTLAKGLAQAAQGRHLMLWSRDQAMQRAWEKAGIAGTLEDSSLMVSMLNYSGTKLDQFMKIDTEMFLTADTTGTEVKLVITAHNNTPPGEPSYIAGPYVDGGGLKAGTYGGVLTVNVPGKATDLRIEETKSLVVDGPDGMTRVVGESFTLDAGAMRKTTVSFHLPKGVEVLHVEPAARVPSMTWKLGKEVFDSESSHWVAW